jgi:hypothetical protein
LSARSAAQKSPETRPKHYRNGVFCPRTGRRREREGVFQHAGAFSEVELPVSQVLGSSEVRGSKKFVLPSTS